MERANDFAPSVDDDGDMEGFAFARAARLFCLRWRKERRTFLRRGGGWLLFHSFQRKGLLCAVGGTFKRAGLGGKLLQSFGASVQGDPVVVVTVGTADAKGIGFGGAGEHEDFLTSMLRGLRDGGRGREVVGGGRVIGRELENDDGETAMMNGEARKLANDWVAAWNAQDRKSTRLNSSHQIISYAGFCLKKKKKLNNWC